MFFFKITNSFNFEKRSWFWWYTFVVDKNRTNFKEKYYCIIIFDWIFISVVYSLKMNYFDETDGHPSNQKILQHTDAPQNNQNTSTTHA